MATSRTGKPKRLRRKKVELERLDERLYEIVKEQQPITVRGIYYQAEVVDLVPKNEAGYGVVLRRVLKLRRAGVIPYAWITDGTRYIHGYDRYEGPAAFATEVGQLYRKDYWARAPVRVEVWIEKDALAGVVAPVVVGEWGLQLFVARGFSSETYLHNAGEGIAADGRPTYVYVLGDFDPSGECAAGKIMQMLPRFSGKTEVHVEQLALNFDQVSRWKLPTREVKMSDSRAPKFVQKYGRISCELDAMAPTLMRSEVSGAIARHADPDAIATLKMIEREERQQIMAMFSRPAAG